MGIIVTVTVGAREENYKWESTEGGSIGLELTGFVILIIGNLVYGQILKIPILQPKDPSKYARLDEIKDVEND